MTRDRHPRHQRVIHGGLLAGAVVVTGAVAFLGATSPVPADGPRIPVAPSAPPPSPVEVAAPAPGSTAPPPASTTPDPPSTPSPGPQLASPTPDRLSPRPNPAAPEPTRPATPGSSTPGPSTIGLEPVVLALPALGVQAPVIAVGLDAGGGVEVPDEIATVGWFDQSARIGSNRGSSVLVGHRDAADIGVGALGAIETLNAGDVVDVTVSDGQVVRYAVRDVTYVEKANFASIVREVFDREGPPRLTLITCGGAFDDAAGSYLSNVIVTAYPVNRLLSTAGGALALP